MMKRTRWLCRLIAFLLLAACTSGDRQQRLAQLEELERQNVADSLMTNSGYAHTTSSGEPTQIWAMRHVHSPAIRMP